MDTIEQLRRDGDYDAHHHLSSADLQTEATVMLDRQIPAALSPGAAGLLAGDPDIRTTDMIPVK